MRDAFGSTFMFKILIVFIVFFTSFMCVAVQCAKIFRARNEIITTLEVKQYSTEDGNKLDDSIIGVLNKYSLNYVGDDSNIINSVKSKCGDGHSVANVCINNLNDNGKPYYKVTVYFVISFPFISDFIIPISGETEVIR